MHIFIRIFFLLIFYIPVYNLYCQHLHDNNILQYIQTWDGTEGLARLVVDQKNDTIIHEIKTTKFLNPNVNICMSDSLGNFIFGSDGLTVFNKYFEKMSNGDSINKPGIYSDEGQYKYSTENYGYIGKSTNAIPLPGQPHQYIFVLTSVYTDSLKRFQYALSYTRIDMQDSIGIVLEKNKILLTRSTDTPIFIKHANGIDWWLISADSRANNFYVFLIDNRGIVGPLIQKEGSIIDSTFWYLGILNYNKLVASPNGERLISQKSDFLDIFKFNRCNGMISMLKKVEQIKFSLLNSTIKVGPSEFSSNSKYYYYSIGRNFYQMNIESNSPEFSIQKIGHITYNPFTTMMKRIGSKILIGSNPSFVLSPFLGLISKVDLPGSACQLSINLFSNYPIQSPYANMGHIPPIPNYHLKADQSKDVEQCQKGFFYNELEPVTTFTSEGRTFHTLLRQFKK